MSQTDLNEYDDREKKTNGSKYATEQIRPTPVCFTTCKDVVFHAFISFERQEGGGTPASMTIGSDMGQRVEQDSDSLVNQRQIQRSGRGNRIVERLFYTVRNNGPSKLNASLDYYH
jgi:hypothetical protein